MTTPSSRSPRWVDSRIPAVLCPLSGLVEFVRHPYLWPLLRARLLPAVLLSAIVIVTLFIWTYLPQVAFLALFHNNASAFVNGVFLVLGEGAAVTAILFECFLADEAQVNVFDAVLVSKGHEELVSNSRDVRPVIETDSEGEDPLRRLGSLRNKSTVYSPFSFQQITEFILLLPLNFVPWIGVPTFLWLTGYRAGPLQHHRYFELKKFTKAEKNDWVKKRRLEYTSFGCTALVIQLVPVLSMMFLLTTAAGSALWAAQMEDMEKGKRSAVPPTSPPPEYTEYVDDPV